MRVRCLEEKQYIDPEHEINYNIFSTIKDPIGPHSHEFFELFLITQGAATHVLNGKKQTLAAGSIAFIRPGEVHYFESNGSVDCRFINLVISVKMVSSLLDYLGTSFFADKLYIKDYQCIATLSGREKEWVQTRLERVNSLPSDCNELRRLEFRVLLADIFSRIFILGQQNSAQVIPLWLQQFNRKLQMKENYNSDMSLLYKKTGKRYEYVCRMFKKYYGKTPTQFVNEEKMNYSASLLTSSNFTILDIALECGFSSISHFYRLFKDYFGISPAEFRKAKGGNSSSLV